MSNEKKAPKRSVGVCYSAAVDDLILSWASTLQRVTGIKPTRGNAIALMAQTLNQAGWQPGDKIPSVKQKGARADSTRPRAPHQDQGLDAGK